MFPGIATGCHSHKIDFQPTNVQGKRKEFLKVAMWSSKQISSRYIASGATEETTQLDLVESLLGHLEIVNVRGSDTPAMN